MATELSQPKEWPDFSKLFSFLENIRDFFKCCPVGEKVHLFHMWKSMDVCIALLYTPNYLLCTGSPFHVDQKGQDLLQPVLGAGFELSDQRNWNISHNYIAL